MKLTRRAALRAGGGLVATAGLAGCIERRVTRRETNVENGSNWVLNPDVGTAVDREAFQAYVDEMADRYGDSGVWGLDGEPADGFETAYLQRLVLSEESPGGGETSLVPESVDTEDAGLVVDAAVAVYRVGEDRHRYWLWAAADGADERIVREVDVANLAAGVSFPGTVLADAAQVSAAAGEANASLGSPPRGRFPLREGTAAVDTDSELGEGGHYVVDWNGAVDGDQSVNGVCEEERDGEHDFVWRVGAGYTRAEDV
jgi:hypothetical protein